MHPHQLAATASEFLAARTPRLHRLVRRVWRLLTRWLPADNSYWERRKHARYYQQAIAFARTYVPTGESVLDVGAATTEVLLALDWFPRRVALDLNRALRRPGVESIVIDFMRYAPPRRFDLVLCLQVLEHTDDPVAFARKLLRTGRIVILSVPYRWPAGVTPGHRHDEVDETTLRAWTGREPIATLCVNDHGDRLLAVYRGD